MVEIPPVSQGKIPSGSPGGGPNPANLNQILKLIALLGGKDSAKALQEIEALLNKSGLSPDQISEIKQGLSRIESASGSQKLKDIGALMGKVAEALYPNNPAAQKEINTLVEMLMATSGLGANKVFAQLQVELALLNPKTSAKTKAELEALIRKMCSGDSPEQFGKDSALLSLLLLDLPPGAQKNELTKLSAQIQEASGAKLIELLAQFQSLYDKIVESQ